jgi:hypothetical protein
VPRFLKFTKLPILRNFLSTRAAQIYAMIHKKTLNYQCYIALRNTRPHFFKQKQVKKHSSNQQQTMSLIIDFNIPGEEIEIDDVPCCTCRAAKLKPPTK